MKKLLFILLVFSAVNGIAQTSYQSRIAIAHDTGFVAKVRMAAYIAAQNIIADTSAASRILKPFANEIYRNPFGGWIDVVTMGVLTNPVINASSSDGDIQYTINNGIFTTAGKAWVNYIEPVSQQQFIQP